MAASPDPFPPSVRRRRRRRLIFVSLAFLLMIGTFALYRRATHPERIRALALQALQRMFRGHVTLEQATFDWSEGIILRQIRVGGPADPNAASPDSPGSKANGGGISIPYVSLHARPWHLFSGNPRFDSVVVVGPEIRLLYDAESRRFDAEDWLAVPRKASNPRMDTLPNIDLRDVRLLLNSREALSLRTIEDLTVNIRCRSIAGDSPIEVAWDQPGMPAIRGQLRFAQLTDAIRITGDLPALSTETALAILKSVRLPPQLDALRLEPAGRIQLTQLDVRWKSGSFVPQAGSVELRDARASIPIDAEDEALDSEARFLRLHDVDGALLLTTKGVTANLRGFFRESTLSVDFRLTNGTPGGSPLAQAPWELRISGTSVHVPRLDPNAVTAEQRWLRSHPEILSIYRDYDPQGLLDFVALIRQSETAQRPGLENLSIAVRSGDASSRFFPYRVSNLAGSIEYGPDGLVIRNLCGTRENAQVCVDADSEHLEMGAAANVHVVGKGLPIDDELKRELAPALLRVIDQFSPKGTIDLELDLSRPSGPPGTRTPWRSVYRVDMNDVDAHISGLNLTADRIRGSLAVDGNRRLALDLVGQSLGTEVAASGFAQLGRDGINGYDVRIHSDWVPIEPATVSILPRQLQNKVQNLALTGSLGLDARIWNDTAEEPPQKSCTLHFDDLRIDDRRLPLPVDRIAGVIHLSPDFVELENVVGCIATGELSMNGTVSLGDDRAMLEIAVRDLAWNEDWKAVLPQEWQRHLQDWTYDGAASGTIWWNHDAASDSSDLGSYAAEIVLDGNGSLYHRAMEEPLRRLTAQVEINGVSVTARQVTTLLDDSPIFGHFEHLTTAPGSTTSVRLDTGELPAEGDWSKLLPEVVAPIWKRGPTGTLSFQGIELDHWHDLESSSSRWTLNGEVGFRDFSMGSDGAVQRLTSVLSGSISSDPILGLSAQGNLHGPTAILFGQEIADVATRWSAVQGPENTAWVRFNDIRGSLYDGTLDASIDLQIEPSRTDYSMTATMIGMSLEKWIRTWRVTQAQPGDQGELGGLVELQVRASGTLGDVASRRGMGRLSIANAQIYRTPLLLAILSILNLAIPSGEAFDEVMADFYLVGSRIDLNDVTLRGKGLMLFGSGTMSWPDQTVNLRFYHVSPRWWTKVPVLSDVMETAVRELIELRVTGSLSQPKVSAQPLRSLTDELKNLLQKKRPRPLQPSG